MNNNPEATLISHFNVTSTKTDIKQNLSYKLQTVIQIQAQIIQFTLFIKKRIEQMQNPQSSQENSIWILSTFYNNFCKMTSFGFLLEKDEINCLCFQTDQNHMGSIYDQSERSCEMKNTKYSDFLLAKKITSNQINKKKSLRNKKRLPHLNFVKNSHLQILAKDYLNLNPLCRQIKKQQTSKIYMDFPTIEKQNINAYLPIKQINGFNKSQSESQNLKNQTFKALTKIQFEELVDEEFRKDLHLFCLSMEKNTQNSKQNKNNHQEAKDQGEINQKYVIQEEKSLDTLFLYAKQIESEKDGTDTESASSEIIGRGLEGLTERKISFLDFQQIIVDGRKTDREKTMMTRESQIDISQIKTFTEPTSSFTMLRTKKRTSLLQGPSFQKQGSIGLSKQMFSRMTFQTLNHPV